MATFVVVDDSKVARKFLTALLRESGHDVIGEAANGEEAYEQYTKLMPDIIMLDITMPVLNGIDCLNKIRSDFPEVKAIIVTSIGKESKKAEAENCGALGYIVKPFEPDEVMETIERILSSAR